MTAPLDPSISDLLRGSSLAPLMDQPVSHILHSMGLPPLPTVPPAPPLPGLPPLPTIDLSAIVRPLTDLSSSFGTGQFGSHGAAPSADSPSATTNAPDIGNAPAAHPTVDPTQVLQAITTGLQTALQIGTSALQLAMQLWQGQGSQQAASTGAQAQSSGQSLVTQGVGQKAILGAGATSVFTGAGLMAAVMAKYMTTAALATPFLAAPGGQAFLVEATVEAIAEALVVVAKTRVEMMIHSASMTEAGTKVPVSSVPKGLNLTRATSSGSSSNGLQQLMQLVAPMGQLLGTGVQSAAQLAPAVKSLSTTNTAKSGDGINSGGALGAYPGEHDQGGSGGGGGALVGGPVAAAPLAPLTPWTGTQVAGGASYGNAAANASEAAAVEPAAATPMSTSSPGYMPVSGVGALGAAKGTGAGAVDSGVPSALVTSSNGDAVVGPMEGVSQPVVGAFLRGQAEPPPDKELTL